jgi:hypothetical protein
VTEPKAPPAKTPAGDLVEVTVSRGHTIAYAHVERFERIGKDGKMEPFVVSTLRNVGPGKTIRVTPAEARRLRALGSAVDPEAPAKPEAETGAWVSVHGQKQMVAVKA